MQQKETTEITNYRMTKQRDLILKALQSVKNHPSAEEIYLMVKKKIPNISFGTVYRNLRILKEQGLLIELNYGKNFSRFDGRIENHYHFSCVNCGNVLDLDEKVRCELNKKIAAETGLHVLYHRLEFYGLCKKCSD